MTDPRAHQAPTPTGAPSWQYPMPPPPTQWNTVPARYPLPQPRTVVTRYPVETNHTFHLLLTVFTCFAWLPVWMAVWIINSLRRRKAVLRG